MNEAPWFRPDPESARSSRIGRFLRARGLPATPAGYDMLHRWSIDDPESFWPAALRELGLRFHRPFERVLDESRGPAWARFFPGGGINTAALCLDDWLPTRAACLALAWEGDDGQTREWTLQELADEVGRAATLLAARGIGRGDRVAIFLPMLPETAAALLAILRLGAIAVPCFSGYGADAVAARLEDAGACALITADGFLRRGRPVRMKETADKAIELAGNSVTTVIVVPRLGLDLPMREGRDHFWPTSEAELALPPIADTDAEETALLMYTSGTTGRPKGVVATHGGFPLKIATDLGFGFDLEAGDRLLWVTDLGWVMGPWMILGSLVLGASMVMVEGTPDYPEPDHLWEVATRRRVTHLGLAPTVARALREKGDAWATKHKMADLRVLGSTGEAWNPAPYQWLAEVVGGGRCPIINYSGGTEIGGGILFSTPVHPIYSCGFSAAIPGIDADVFDASGQPLRDEVGELVIRRPWPGMTVGFWQDDERYEETYWSRWKDVWVHGDWARRTAAGWTIEGRSDDTIKIAGKRLGPAEVESLLAAHPAVLESAAIEVPHPIKGGALVCYIVLQSGQTRSEELRKELHACVATGLGKAMAPSEILFATALPKTRSAKVMRRLIRAIHIEQSGGEAAPGDTSALDDPSTLEALRAAE
ncbi:MAG: AMP-binding protein [Deltaproteobacteria bacterium]